jgi:uncharacterized protein (DUF2132 family)
MTADKPDSNLTEHETTEGSKPSIVQPAPAAAAPPTQPRNPLHGVTLEAIVTALADRYGWARLGERIPVRCFNVDPSVASSLRFLRKTPWAREKVEDLYLAMESNRKRANQRRR